MFGGICAVRISRAISSGWILALASWQPLMIKRAASMSVRPVRWNRASTTIVGAPGFGANDVTVVFSFPDVYSLFLIRAAIFGAPKLPETAAKFGAQLADFGAPDLCALMICSSSSTVRSGRRGAG